MLCMQNMFHWYNLLFLRVQFAISKNSRDVKHRHAMHCHLTLIRKRRRIRNVGQLIDTTRCEIAKSITLRGDKSAQIEGLPRRGWPTTCAHEQALTRAWNQAPARTSARLGDRRTIRIDILINERWVGPMSELLVRQKGRVRECTVKRGCGRAGVLREEKGRTNAGWIRTRVFDGVATADAWPEARVCRALRISFYRKRHSRGPLALVRLFADTVVVVVAAVVADADTFLNKQYTLPTAATLEKVWPMVPSKKKKKKIRTDGELNFLYDIVRACDILEHLAG